MSRSSLKPFVGAACVFVFSVIPFSNFAAERRGGSVNYFQEDFPFQGACISAKGPSNNVALKGLAIRVGNDANMLWDTDLLRFAAGWAGGYISGNGVVYSGGARPAPGDCGNAAIRNETRPGMGERQR